MAQYEKRPVGQITKNIGGLVLPRGSVSTRCRVKHDTPKGFAARCVLPEAHGVYAGVIGATTHEDKYGNQWEDQ